MKQFKIILSAFLALAISIPSVAIANDEIAELKAQIADLTEELEDLDDRVSAPERHSALDRIKITGDFRTRAHTLHYDDISSYMGADINVKQSFDNLGMSGMYGAAPDEATAGMMMAGMPSMGPAMDAMMADPAMQAAVMKYLMGQNPGQYKYAMGQAQKYDKNNDIMYDSRLRLNIKADVWKNVDFDGRLTMYKTWGDSTGVRVMDGMGDVAIDGTGSGYASGDVLRVERAYFNWKNINDSNFYLSIGRRPSTYGPPVNIRENELRGGTPSGHLVNFNFDGITLGYKAEELTGMPGSSIRFCYGQGFESEFGNGSLGNQNYNIEDTHLGGFNIDAYNDGQTLVQATLFRAQDIADGFTGLAVFPNWAAQMGMMPGVVTRWQPTVNVGDMDLLGIGITREEDNGVKWFTSLGYNKTHPNGKFNGMGFGGLMFDTEMVITGMDADGNPIMEMQAKDADSKDGFSIYAGVQAPLFDLPIKIGAEYNYGSKYWFNFTQASDDIIGSKLATRGHVGEVYGIWEVNPKMFIKLGGIYYDYEFTGSGSPLGKPQKVSDVQDGKAWSAFPAIDTAWSATASLTMKF